MGNKRLQSEEATAAALVERGWIVFRPPATDKNWKRAYGLACAEEERPQEPVRTHHEAARDLGQNAAITLLEGIGLRMAPGTLREGKWGMITEDRSVRVRGDSLVHLLQLLFKLGENYQSARALVVENADTLQLALLLANDPGGLYRAVIDCFTPWGAAVVLGDEEEQEGDDPDGDDEDDEDDDDDKGGDTNEGVVTLDDFRRTDRRRR